MPSVTRRRLLAGGAAAVAGTYGAVRLNDGATDASFGSWTPAPGTWPLARYDPANTAHSPDAAPPREEPGRRELVSVAVDDSPYFFPLVGPGYLSLHGTTLAVYPRSGGDAVHAVDSPTPLAGFGPDGSLHGIHPDPSNSTSTLVGLDATDLSETHRVSLDTGHPSGMALSADEVYVGTPRRDVHAIDTGSGRRWRVGGTMPAIANDRLYAAGAMHDGTVAYEERTGFDRRLQAGPRQRWSGGFAAGEPHLPAVADGRVVLGTFGFHGGIVCAYDAESGERLWEPRSLGMDVATPAVVGDRGYTAVGTDGLTDGLVAAIDLDTGETVWRDEVDWYAFSPAVGADTLVVAGEVRNGDETTAAKVRAYDIAAGDVLWTHTIEGGDPTAIALVEDRVLVTSRTSLYELA